MKPSAAFSRFFLFPAYNTEKRSAYSGKKISRRKRDDNRIFPQKRIGFFADERAAIRRIKALIICIKPPAPVRWILRIFHPKKP
jgi:hypothetical protein